MRNSSLMDILSVLPALMQLALHIMKTWLLLFSFISFASINAISITHYQDMAIAIFI